MIIEHLKPCPYCGSTDIFLLGGSGDWNCWCKNCEAQTKKYGNSSLTFNDKEARRLAVEAWNRRSNG